MKKNPCRKFRMKNRYLQNFGNWYLNIVVRKSVLTRYGSLRLRSLAKVLSGQWFRNPYLRQLAARFACKSTYWYENPYLRPLKARFARISTEWTVVCKSILTATYARFACKKT